jgi:cytochrome b
MITVRIWDLPTRLFHWLLVACVMGLVITGQLGGNAMVWHFRLGYAVFSLLAFRLIWGFVGGYWSRWVQLPLHPRHLLAYWRGQAGPRLLAGHNPMGSWSVLGLIGVLALQVATGLVSDDEIANAGPLTSLVPGAWVSLATHWHKQWGKLLLIALVLTHVAAIAWYRFKSHALLPAMLHGDKTLNVSLPTSRDDFASRIGALVLMLCCAAGVAWLVSLGS